MFPKPRSSAASPARYEWCWIHNGSPPMASPRRRREATPGREQRGEAGSFARDNQEFKVEAGKFFTRAEELQQVVVGVHAGRPVYLRDVVEKMEDGPAEPDNYVMFANARGGAGQSSRRGISRSHDHAGQAQRHERHDHF